MKSTTEVRAIEASDQTALERFFERQWETTLFLRSNLARAGWVDRGEPYQGTYRAAFSGSEIVALAAHYWNGMVILHADTHAAAVASAVIEKSGRPVAGFIGPRGHVLEACRELGRDPVQARLDSKEDLFTLTLCDLRIPGILASGRVHCRAAHDSEIELLTEWRVAYSVEALNERESPGLHQQAKEAMKRSQREASHWVAEADGVPVSYSAFNAQLPDCVQIGGVYTPPELRSRGYARAVVAGSLLIARERGVKRSVLFTPTDNAAAQRAYRSLGYERVCDYSIVQF